MSVPTISILSEGKRIVHDYSIVALDIQHEVNRVPYALLSLDDGDPSKATFYFSNHDYFMPGNVLEIKIRSENDASTETTLFKGIIVKQAIEVHSNTSLLNLELKDSSFKMTTHRESKVHLNNKESDIFREIIDKKGETIGDIDPLDIKHQELVQHYCTDWDFLLSRADVYGYWVVVQKGTISVRNPQKVKADGTPPVFTFGNNIKDMQLELNAEKQVKEISSIHWDPEEGAGIEIPYSGTSENAALGGLSFEEVAEVTGDQALSLQSVVPLQVAEQEGWAKGKLSKTRMAMLRGRLTVNGQADIWLLDTIELAGISNHFNGNTVVSGVRHRINSNKSWETDIQFGMPADDYTEQYKVESNAAGGLLPGIKGIQLGIIDAFEENSKDQYQMKVSVPALNASVWARLANPYAGDSRGFFFRPETGDKVIVGFLNDDPRQAIILGSLFNANVTPPIEEDISEENPVKGIFMQEGLHIKFDEENKILEIQTSEDQYLKLDQQGGSIEMQDTNGNQVRLAKDGITLISEGDINVEASGNIQITGNQVDIQG